MSAGMVLRLASLVAQAQIQFSIRGLRIPSPSLIEYLSARLAAGPNDFSHSKDPRITMKTLQTADPEIWAAIDHERVRQKEGLELIASENYTSAAVLEAAGTILTNKYAEGDRKSVV